ncbi:hypothetical protein [Paractinoplanes rishiriensis]|uniref:Uncharacterized protein n=1 Tax=Paractinoplanes rishiriensis TaxID=1050105 RepID=A0A919K1C3_9ACTN|nr:hypothetical protein [Actinoplanes rishiriensis]GIE98835.1 hypothetical protein Ari01nite_63000 [Actinoplanes rishiriensis]
MAQGTREMPVRADGWRPTDQVFEGIIKRCVEDAEAGASRDGTREYMAGAVILVVLLVVMLMAGVPTEMALLIPGVLFGAGALYMITATKPEPVKRHRALAPLGGPGRLPAGYLVHPRAWQAGMAEHVAYIPESQLRAAAELCSSFPGSVDDLLIFTGTIAAQFPAPRNASGADVDRRARDLVLVGMPILRDYNEKYPAPKPAPAKGKKK